MNVSIFREEVQLVMHMLSEILGDDDDKSVTEVRLVFLLRISFHEPESNQICCLGLDELLASVIHSQSMDFPKLRCFRYQSYLLNMLLCSNVSELHFTGTIFSPCLPKKMNVFDFVNKFMAELYRIIFDMELHRVLEEKKNALQPSPKSYIGYWFLYKEFIVIRVYGFTRAPYKFPIFFMPRIFALEFIRQRLC